MNETESTEADTTPRPRNPWVAAALSVALPGLGHYYVGRRTLAIWTYLGYVAAINVAFAILIFVNFKPYNVVVPVLMFLLTYVMVVGSAYRLARRADREGSETESNRWYHYVLILAVGILLSLWCFPVWTEYEAFRVPTGSMQDALLPGDFFLADMRAYRSRGPERNDIVVFRYSEEPQIRYTDRCVALPGDTIEIRLRRILINGEEYEHPATMHWAETGGFRRRHGGPLDKLENMAPFVVPADHYFLLGDNLSNASDSRLRGPVHHDHLLGRAVRIYWSSDLSRVGLPAR